jgi:hypothetical protein
MSLEILMLVTIGGFSFCMTQNKSIVFIVIIALVMIMTNNGYMNISARKHGVSAGVAQTTSEELPFTKNPRLTSVSSASSTDNKKDGEDEKDTSAMDLQVGGKNYVNSLMNAADYTIEGIENKRQERIFRKHETTHHSTEERARLLNSLYSDLLRENYKKDPYMVEEDGNDCEPIKGRVDRVNHNDC